VRRDKRDSAPYERRRNVEARTCAYPRVRYQALYRCMRMPCYRGLRMPPTPRGG